MITAIMYRVSWNEAALVAALRFALWSLLLLVVVLSVPLLVAAVTPFVVGCCSAVAANAGAWAMVPVVFAGAWAVKP